MGFGHGAGTLATAPERVNARAGDCGRATLAAFRAPREALGRRLPARGVDPPDLREGARTWGPAEEWSGVAFRWAHSHDLCAPRIAML